MPNPYTNNAGVLFADETSGIPIATEAYARDYVDGEIFNYGSTGIINLGPNFFMTGNISTGTDKFRYTVPISCAFVSCFATVGTAPATTSILIDINKNGTTIFTTQGSRVTIAASATSGQNAGTPEVTAFSAGDIISFDVDQIGTGTVGAMTAVTLLLNPLV